MRDLARRRPALAHVRYVERRDELSGLTPAERFALIHRTNLWGAAEAASGLGSELAATATVRTGLQDLLARYGVRRLLDLPCGEFAWMAAVDLTGIEYIGGDIVPDIVAVNRTRHAVPGRGFRRLDLLEDDLPQADLVLCRDCLVHFSFANICCALQNLRASGARYLLTTSFVELPENSDIDDGDWRPLNLQVAPFRFPPPLEVFLENCTEAGGDYRDKALALWGIEDLPEFDLP